MPTDMRRLMALAEAAVRPALAYRWMTAEAAAALCASDALSASWRHFIPWLGKTVAGLSMSRNPRYRQAGPVRIAFDLLAIRTTNEVLPLSADYVFDLARQRRGRAPDPTQKYDRQARFDPLMPKSHDFERDRADEEFVAGGIERASRCIVGIEHRADADPALVAALRDYAEAKGLPAPQPFAGA